MWFLSSPYQYCVKNILLTTDMLRFVQMGSCKTSHKFSWALQADINSRIWCTSVAVFTPDRALTQAIELTSHRLENTKVTKKSYGDWKEEEYKQKEFLVIQSSYNELFGTVCALRLLQCTFLSEILKCTHNYWTSVFLSVFVLIVEVNNCGQKGIEKSQDRHSDEELCRWSIIPFKKESFFPGSFTQRSTEVYLLESGRRKHWYLLL